MGKEPSGKALSLQLKSLWRGQGAGQRRRRRLSAHGVVTEMTAVEVKGHRSFFRAQHFVAAKIAGVLTQGAYPAGRFVVQQCLRLLCDAFDIIIQETPCFYNG